MNYTSIFNNVDFVDFFRLTAVATPMMKEEMDLAAEKAQLV